MNNFRRDGYAVVSKVLTKEQIAELKLEIRQTIDCDSAYGIRQIDCQVPAIYRLAYSSLIIKCLELYTDCQPKLVKAIYFNKTLENNWFVGWHQDKTIGVREKIETPGFINWTVKQSIPHVQPTLDVMQKIVTLRLHLDRAGKSNGALQLIPRSHHRILNSQEIEHFKAISEPKICEVEAGDALIMSPLVLHSSPKSQISRNNRSNNRAVIHLEYSTANLPNNLHWA